MLNKKFKAMVVVCLLLVLCMPSSFGLFKRTINSNGLRAAAWNVAITPDSNNSSMYVIPGGANVSYTLTVSNNSEVDVNYEIVVSNLPSGVEVKLDSGSFETPTNGSVTFSNANTNISYSDQSHTKTHTLTFKANTGATEVTNQSISVDVQFKQDI